jgi:hypothetical protein
MATGFRPFAFSGGVPKGWSGETTRPVSPCSVTERRAGAKNKPAGFGAGGLFPTECVVGSELGRKVAVHFESDADFHVFIGPSFTTICQAHALDS